MRQVVRVGRWVGIAVLVAVVVWVVVTGAVAVDFYTTAATSLDRLQAQPTAGDVSAISRDLSVKAERLTGLLMPITPLARALGGDGCAAANLISTGNALSPYGDDFSELIGAAYAASGMLGENSLDVRDLREAWQPEAARGLHAAADALLVLPECANVSERLDGYARATRGVLVMLRVLAAMPVDAMLQDGQRWLVVMNNSDELRATGGFTTALATLWVEDGVLRWTFGNSYSVDNLDRLYYHPTPPTPMLQFMAIHRLMFRDANWSPDHPTAAAMALRLYQLDQGQSANGLITINMTALPTLLDVLPPFAVNGQMLDAEGGLDLLRSAWNEGAANYNSDAPERKQFIAETAAELANAALTQIHPLDLAAGGAAVDAMLARRDIMLYAADADMQAVFAANGWDGAMIARDGDNLMVVDTNIGYNKVTPRVAASIDYRVDLSETPTAVLTLRYENTNTDPVPCSVVYNGWERQPDSDLTTYVDRMNGCFWNYARVFTPTGTRLIDFSSADIPADWFPFSPTAHAARVDALRESAFNGFGTMTVTPPGETLEVTFSYELPETILQRDGDETSYRLTIQRQAGSAAKAVTVTVELPEGATLIEASAGSRIDGDTVVFEGMLAGDWEIAVRWE